MYGLSQQPRTQELKKLIERTRNKSRKLSTRSFLYSLFRSFRVRSWFECARVQILKLDKRRISIML